MKTFFKIIGSAIVLLVIICGISFLTNKSRFGEWTISNQPAQKNELSWIKFYWTSDSFGNKFYERTAIFIPAKIEGLSRTFSFQFDLGSDLTMLYEKNARSVFGAEFNNHTGKLKGPLQFWNSARSFKNITLDFGSTKATTENCAINKNYGEEISSNDVSEARPATIGTIGADLFQGKVLIIDYPNQRFAICESLPDSFNTYLTKIELDNVGRVLLPLTIHGKNYKALFDNGSSLFPLLVTDNKVNDFSTSPGMDTIEINSWGQLHKVIGRQLQGSFQLGGKTFSNTLVYADYRKEARTNRYDAIARNRLFWDKIIVIDFKNKMFGVK